MCMCVCIHPEGINNYSCETAITSLKSSFAFQFLYIALVIDIMVGCGLSNKARHECLLRNTKGDAVIAIQFIVGGV